VFWIDRLHTIWLVLALAAVSATRLRFASIPIGLGEVMLLAWLAAVAPKAFNRRIGMRPIQARLLVFWLAFFVLLALGALWAYTGGVSSPGAARDAAAFAFAAVVSLAFAGTFGASIPVRSLSRWIVAVQSVYLGCLGLIHYASPGLVTRPDDYGSRLTGLTANPNQLAMYLAALPFVTLYLLMYARGTLACAALAAAVFAQMLAGTAVGSDALSLTWLTGAGGILLAAWHARRRGRALPNQLLIVLLAGALVAFATSGFILRHSSMEDLKADLSEAVAGAWITLGGGQGRNPTTAPDIAPTGAIPNGQPSATAEGGAVDWEKVQIRTRAGLWRSGIEVVARSPLVGFGPGRHAGNGIPFQGDEVHQSFIDLATMGGIPAALLFAWILWTAASPRRRMGSDGYVACIIVAALTAFASFHFMVRQPVFWFYIALAAALSRSDVEATA
jgi:hypothetical protein